MADHAGAASAAARPGSASTTESPPVMSDLTAATIERTLYDIAQTLASQYVVEMKLPPGLGSR